jgi:hypothetical protein
LSVEGVVVRFRDASGEVMRFEKPLPLEEMRRETGDGDSSGTGCGAGFTALPIPFALAVFVCRKNKRS